MDTSETHQQRLIRRFYAELWNAHDTTKAGELLADDFRFRGSLGDEASNPAGFIAYVDKVHRALGDYTCEIEEMVGDGDCVFASVKFSGLHKGELLGHAPTGKWVNWTGFARFRLRYNKIFDLRVLGDLHTLESQLQA
jgi:predicted ester cyclase